MNPHYDRSAWLQGPAHPCKVAPLPALRQRRLVLLGPPGVGKGTQAALLSAGSGACHLSMGDLLRCARHCATDDASGLKAIGTLMDAGELVPDEYILRLIRARAKCLSCSSGFILDGFPRTVSQAAALDVILGELHLELHHVLNYELPAAELVGRVGGRRTCPVCRDIYHAISRPPFREGLCDRCGCGLQARPDDRPESVVARHHAFVAAKIPLLNYYLSRGRLTTISALGSPTEILARTVDAMS